MIKIELLKNGSFNILHNNQTIGSGNFLEKEHDDDIQYLERIDIEPEHRNKGCRTEALNILSDIFGSYYLTPDNKDAKRLYDRIGYEISNHDYDKFGFAIDQGYGVYETY